MKRVLELIISLIATAATYALMHVVLFMDLFKFQHKLPVYVPTVIAVIVGLIFYFLLATPLAGLLLKRLNQTEERLSKMNLKELSLSVIGCIVGLVLANLIGMAFNGFGALGTFIVVLLNILFGILGIRVARRKKDDVNVRTLKEVLMTTPPSTAEDSIYGRPKILDTSVIIDGRILDLLQTGFIEGKIIIPDFVLEELRHIADSADSLKRQRGRRGLDILNEIQKQLAVPVEIQSFHPGQQMEVDSMLLKMADSMDAFVVTNDFNLNKVAEFQGVRVLNINELSNAVKPVVLPGEEMVVTIIKAGKEAGQGVAYLNDGTMIVVDGGSKHIGETITVIVNREEKKMSISTAVIVAAGKGKRMGTEISKQFLPLCGKEILAHTVEKFEKAACIRDIILVTGGDALQDVRQMVQEYGWKKIISVTEGGKERQDSVFLGLQQVPQDTEIVLIHDGVRPFVTEEILERSIAAAKETGGCVAGVPAKDTIKVCDAEGFAIATPDRSTLRQIQTPQTFRRKEILAAYEKAKADGFLGTDDASVAEHSGFPVRVIMGSYRNIKITTKEDLLIGAAFLKEETE